MKISVLQYQSLVLNRLLCSDVRDRGSLKVKNTSHARDTRYRANLTQIRLMACI